MPSNRIRGQEVSVLLVVDGAPEAALTNVQNFEITLDLEKQEEAYLGETSNRYDEMYKGLSFKMDVHNSDPGLFDFFDAVKSRAQRQTPGVQVNVKATLQYPSGDRRRVIIQDVYFEPMGLSFGGRMEYGSTSVAGSAAEYRVI
jgi:hypothetical protein